MPVIHLVRHGQASFGLPEYDVLSELGRRQAAVVGAELARRGLRDPLVVCGTLHRQYDTAELLMKAAGLSGTPARDPHWNEYDHLRLLDRHGPPAPGAHADSRAAQHLLDQALQAWVSDPDDDGWTAVSQGAFASLGDLVASLGPGRDAVVVTSGGVLAALCGRLLGTSAAGTVGLDRVAVNAAVTTLVAGGSGISLPAFNDHSHFTGELRELLTYR
ncbi:histidine phosphatase family protein [Streptomyces cupreus]|uniref:Histidine phosphatase family protein n=1 Tax=Streptomyces cupreus TaxID=2759956 RepID=A0A7X1J8R8_9ACTN|nr:histidine phosphatase family protein [Streptomyces cupreus]MBC2905734.1 histidine phosphatase family protein [Streptomyces cupreus]